SHPVYTDRPGSRCGCLRSIFIVGPPDRGMGCLRCVAAGSFPPPSSESDSVCGVTFLRRTMEVCMANVADRIVETLEAANVRRIFGLVGDSLNGITESMR